jgi:hypothetical protein
MRFEMRYLGFEGRESRRWEREKRVSAAFRWVCVSALGTLIADFLLYWIYDQCAHRTRFMMTFHVDALEVFFIFALFGVTVAAFLMGRKRYHQATAARALRSRSRVLLEVWECPRCRHLSKIAAQCDWCTAEMPDIPVFRTVREAEYNKQIPSKIPVVRRPRPGV